MTLTLDGIPYEVFIKTNVFLEVHTLWILRINYG
jgi:hypothetical protein